MPLLGALVHFLARPPILVVKVRNISISNVKFDYGGWGEETVNNVRLGKKMKRETFELIILLT